MDTLMDTLIGIDIGQKRDPTAVCVAQRDSRDEDGRAYTHYLIRHLERLPLGTPYPQVAERIGGDEKGGTSLGSTSLARC
ncbi:MAG: hypothetical protein MI919_31195 [Holophagales bacterium]|nr:hypothetical protein [Holophagales bacterium]